MGTVDDHRTDEQKRQTLGNASRLLRVHVVTITNTWCCAVLEALRAGRLSEAQYQSAHDEIDSLRGSASHELRIVRQGLHRSLGPWIPSTYPRRIATDARPADGRIATTKGIKL